MPQNAGSFHKAAPLDEIPLSSFQSVIGTNLTGTFLCTKEAMRIFKAQQPQGGTYCYHQHLIASDISRQAAS